MTDLRQSLQYAHYMKLLGWQVEKVEGVYCYLKKIPLLGIFIKIQRPRQISPNLIRTLQKKYHPFRILIEPALNTKYKILTTKFGFRQTSPYLPSQTLILTLTQSERSLLSQMHSKTRYNIHLARRKGLVVKLSSNITAFARFWNHQRFGRFSPFSQQKQIIALYRAFGKNAHLLCVYSQGNLLSGILLIISGHTAYYFYAAASPLGKALHAPTLNTWEAILFARQKHCRYFDFEGIFDPRFPQKSWQGFTRFKKSFGGQTLTHPAPLAQTTLTSLLHTTS